MKADWAEPCILTAERPGPSSVIGKWAFLSSQPLHQRRTRLCLTYGLGLQVRDGGKALRGSHKSSGV